MAKQRKTIDFCSLLCYSKTDGLKLVVLNEGRRIMAKRVAGVTEKLMECAKEEFLANGYENASLRIIAEKA